MFDKLLMFGGWKPYENLTEIEVFDQSKNQFESILPLAMKIRGNQEESNKQKMPSKFVSASTARESNTSDPNNDSEGLNFSGNNIEIIDDEKL